MQIGMNNLGFKSVLVHNCKKDDAKQIVNPDSLASNLLQIKQKGSSIEVSVNEEVYAASKTPTPSKKEAKAFSAGFDLANHFLFTEQGYTCKFKGENAEINQKVIG